MNCTMQRLVLFLQAGNNQNGVNEPRTSGSVVGAANLVALSTTPQPFRFQLLLDDYLCTVHVAPLPRGR